MLKLEPGPGLISNPIQGFRMLLAMMPATTDMRQCIAQRIEHVVEASHAAGAEEETGVGNAVA